MPSQRQPGQSIRIYAPVFDRNGEPLPSALIPPLSYLSFGDYAATRDDPERVKMEEQKWNDHVASLQTNTAPLSKSLAEKAQLINIRDIPRDMLCSLRKDIMT